MARKSVGKTARQVKVPKKTKAAAKKSGAATKRAVLTKRATKKPKPARKSPARTKPLGRPLVTAEEKLYMLFHEDFHARQIFEFLKVETVGQLEQFNPQQIIQLLSLPVRQTVERIRERLASQKRHLRNDEDFARNWLASRSQR